MFGHRATERTRRLSKCNEQAARFLDTLEPSNIGRVVLVEQRKTQSLSDWSVASGEADDTGQTITCRQGIPLAVAER